MEEARMTNGRSRYTRRRFKWLQVLGLENTRQKAEEWRVQGLCSTFIMALCVAVYVTDTVASGPGNAAQSYGTIHAKTRHLMATANTSTDTGHGPAWERCDYEQENSKWAWLFNHVFFILVIFIGVAIVCDDFFVPSLEIISEKLKLSEDVAGATFMAAGSSAPELFSSVAGVAVESDVGVGTIVGSAVFNLLIIIALTAALAGQILHLDWRPLSRDAFFYAMSVGCFIGFAWDGEFTHYESAILLVLYILYIILMVFNPRLMEWMGTWRCICMGPRVEPAAEEGKAAGETNGSTTKLGDERKLSLTGGHARRVTIVHMIRKNSLTPDGEHHGRQFVHHQRGSIAGVLMMKHPPRPHHKDSGFMSREGSTYIASTDTSRTDLIPSGQDQSYAKEKSLRPPNQSSGGGGANSSSGSPTTNASLTTSNGSTGESFEMQPTNCQHKPHTVHTTEIQEMSDSTSSDDQLLPAVTLPASAINHQQSPKNSPTSSDPPESPHKLPVLPVLPALVEDEPQQQRENGGKSMSEHELTIPEEEEEEEEDEPTMQICPCLPCCPAVRTYPPSAEDAQKTGGCWVWFKYIFKWVLFIPAFPFVCLYSWTIPNCSKEHLKKWYIVSFLMSVLWIALLSFGMVTLVGRAGCILNIDAYIMGLVVVAVGTSIPDALSSVLVARDGYGDMAVSNAIGSNVFDINLGLGLPFLIRIAIDRGKPISLLSDEEAVDLATGEMKLIQHAKFGFLLLLILAIALVVFVLARFRLNKWIGVCFVIMYIIFLVYAFMQELYCVRTLKIYC